MENSAKRKERLQAMRMDASSVPSEGNSPSFSNTNCLLSNPLIHPSVPTIESSPIPHRFDYYTDPAAAYSTAKRNPSKTAGGIVHGNLFPLPSFSSPISGARPAGTGQMEHHILPTHSPQAHQFPSPNRCLYNTPMPRSQPDSWRTSARYPSPSSGSHNSSGHSFYSTPSMGAPPSGASPVRSAYSGPRGGSPHSQYSGRGWQFRGGSPSPGWTSSRGGRGGYHSKGPHGLGRQHIDSFFNKSMAKDPWRKLKPVVGNILLPLSGPQSFLPKSLTAKKAKVAGTDIDIKPHQNLAEFLALAFEETLSSTQETISPTLNIEDG